MEITVLHCALCENHIEAQHKKKLFARYFQTGSKFYRKVSILPKAELTVTVEGKEGDDVICDNCLLKIEQLLEKISTTSI